MSILDKCVAIDLEATGLNHGKDKVTEIGMIKFENGVEVDRIDMLINPGIKIPAAITEITGITDEMVKDSPYINEVIAEINEFTEGYVLVGHSLMFDYRFLKKASVNAGFEFSRKGIDTLKIARKLFVDIEHKKLDFLCKELGIEDLHHHRAANDAYVTAKLLEIMWERFGGEYPDEFKPYDLEYRVKKEGPITKRQIELLQKLIKQHAIEPDYEIDRLTKNEASRKIDIIYSTYGRV